MKWSRLIKSEPCPSPLVESEKKVVAVSQIIEQDGKETLNLDLYYRGTLKARYFADKEEMRFASFVDGKWRSCMIRNVARICKGKQPLTGDYYYCGDEWEFATNTDEDRAQKYLEQYSVGRWEDDVNYGKYSRAIERKKQRIEERMARIPCVPNDMEEWVKNEIFPENFLYMERKKDRTIYSCTACGHRSWKRKRWKQNEKTICPKCGKTVTAKIWKAERIRKEPVILLQAFDKEWVERQFQAVCRWAAGTKEIELYEQCRAIIPKGECWGRVWYGQLYEADEFEQEFWDTNPISKRFVSSYLYPGNLQQVLPCGNLQNSGLEILAEKKVKMDVNIFITTFHKRPWLEYLIKSGLCQITGEIVNSYRWYGNPSTLNTKASKLKDVLKLDGNRTNRMKQLDGGLDTLEWLQYEQDHNIKITQESLEYLSAKKVGPDDCREILRELGSVKRMVNYMKKQKIAARNLVSIWKDYLSMARAEDMDTTDDIVRLPKDLKARHDQLVEIRNARRDAEELRRNRKKYAELDKQIEKHLPEVKEYFWQDEEYMIIPAGKCEELVTEGRILHHCVGASDRYMISMAEGATWICFLRKKKDLETPYYTLEVRLKDGFIIQWYSKYDRRPDEEKINKVLEKYKKHIKPERLKATVVA